MFIFGYHQIEQKHMTVDEIKEKNQLLVDMTNRFFDGTTPLPLGINSSSADINYDGITDAITTINNAEQRTLEVELGGPGNISYRRTDQRLSAGLAISTVLKIDNLSRLYSLSIEEPDKSGEYGRERYYITYFAGFIGEEEVDYYFMYEDGVITTSGYNQ